MNKRYEINETLFDVAAWRLHGEREKQAFVPQGATDPAAAGGMPPGGDPMAAGGMPPMPPGGDPMAAAGGMPPPMPPGPPMDPMAAAGGMPMAAPAAAPSGPAAGAKPKIDPTFIYQELSRLRKLVTHMMKNTGIGMPDDILDDGTVAMVSQGQMPASAPLGQGGESEMGGQGLPALGGAAPVGPIEPVGGAGGTEKPASDVLSLFRPPGPADRPNFDATRTKLDALAALSRSLGQ